MIGNKTVNQTRLRPVSESPNQNIGPRPMRRTTKLERMCGMLWVGLVVCGAGQAAGLADGLDSRPRLVVDYLQQPGRRAGLIRAAGDRSPAAHLTTQHRC